MSEDENVHNNYISLHFGNIHDLKNIRSEYAKYLIIMKHNYLKYITKDSGKGIIDVGGGLGHTLNALKKIGYTNVAGIDLSLECVDFCR